MQLLNLKEHEGIAWVKILENICTVVDPAKIEFSTDGEWRAALCRCLVLLLRNTKPCRCRPRTPKFQLELTPFFFSEHVDRLPIHYAIDPAN